MWDPLLQAHNWALWPASEGTDTEVGGGECFGKAGSSKKDEEAVAGNWAPIKKTSINFPHPSPTL